MIILAVDTSGPVAGVALMRDERVLYEAVAELNKTHSQSLMPMLEAMAQVTGVAAADVDLFACVAGPGSFTGVRIGVCAVQALAEATGKPCVALNALEVLAQAHAGAGGTVCPILDARRGQVYAAAFLVDGDECVRVMDDAALPFDEYARLLPGQGRLLFVGDGVQAHGARATQLLGARARVLPHHMARIMPGAACALAFAKQGEAVDAAALMPIYLRAPQAEREREERLSHA